MLLDTRTSLQFGIRRETVMNGLENTELNPVSVLGMGACGSNIAFDLSLEIDPLAPFAPQLSGLATLKLSLTDIDFTRIFRKRTKDSSPFYAHNDFYIGDMNIANESYNRGLKISAIREFLQDHPVGSYEELIETSAKELSFSEADKEIFDIIKRNPNAAANVELLSFRKAEGDEYYRDGAGGLQFISEYLAVHDDALYSKIKQRRDGTMVGIFSAGGGTGAGSVFGLLSKYKRDSARYTLGLCILPGRNEGDSDRRAGRFLTRYLSTPKANRFDTLLLFSNYAAMTVAPDFTKDLSEAHTTALAAVNRYLTRFTYYYSIVNHPSTQAHLNKVFDPADGRSYLYDPSFVGLGVGKEGDSYDPSDLFLRSFSPAHFEGGQMQGLGVSFGGEKEDYRRIGVLLRQIFKATREGGTLDELVADISDLTPFYKTLKRLLIFFYVSDHSFAIQITSIANDITRFVNVLTGGDVKISLMAYSGRHVRENCVKVLCSGGLTLELHDSFLSYVREAFFPTDDNQYREFSRKFLDLLAACHAPLTGNQAEEKKKLVGALIEEAIGAEVETFTEGQRGAIDARPSFRKMVDSEEFEEFRLRREHLIEAARTLIDLARMPQVEGTAFSQFKRNKNKVQEQGPALGGVPPI
jgi:hypothetical protein